MKLNREGNLTSETHRECSKKTCETTFEITSKTVTLCNSCNTKRVQSETPEVRMFRRAKQRASSKQQEFSLKQSDITIPVVCPVLGIPLVVKTGKPGGSKNSPALDRVDNSKGYHKDNIQVISHLANMMKSSATDEELITFSKWVLGNVKTAE